MPTKPTVQPAPPAQPRILKEGYDSEGLYFIRIKLRKRTITVIEPVYGVDEARSSFVREVLDLNIKDDARRNTLLLTYSALAAVSTGNVPKAGQLLQMADADVKFWIQSARKVAPSLFVWMSELDSLTAAEGKVVLKKKGKQPAT